MKITRYTLVRRGGILLDYWTAQLWDKLVAKFPGLILTQGVNSGAPASGGTHLGLGVLDTYLGGHSWKSVLKFAFELGFFGWFRPAIAGVWKAHIHLGVRGHPKMAASLKAQQVSWTNLRNGLKGNAKDVFTWRPANFRQAAPYRDPNAKPPKSIKPWVNFSWLNTWGNNDAEGAPSFDDRAPRMAKDSAAGNPGIAAFCEVRQESQLPVVKEQMAARGYLFAGYSHMIAVFNRPAVTIRGISFSRYTRQRGGTVEGILRVKYTADGSKGQVGFTHLDVHSSAADKRHNLKEAYDALKRYGWSSWGPLWKTRTTIAGDFNDPDVASDVLGPLGFKQIAGGDSIDQAHTGKDRPDRGGDTTITRSDHRRLLARLGRR